MSVLEQLLQPLWDVSSEAVVITGNETDAANRRILYVNQAFVRLTGYPREEVIGQPANLLHGPDTDTRTIQASEQKLQSGRAHEYAVQLYRKDGSAFQCSITIAPLVDLDRTSSHLISMYNVGLVAAATDMSRRLERGSVPLTLPMPLQQFISSEPPRHLASHPELDALLRLWQELSTSGALPNRAEFSLPVMRRWASHLSIAVVAADGRFQFKLFGTELTHVYGRDLTGSYLDELTPHDLWSVVTEHYKEVVETRLPLFAPISVTNGRWYTEVSRLLLPLSGDRDVNFVMGADYKRSKL